MAYLSNLYKSAVYSTRFLPGSSSLFGVPRKYSHTTEEYFLRGGSLSDSNPRKVNSGKSSFTLLSDKKLNHRKPPLYFDGCLEDKTLSSLVSCSLPRFVARLSGARYLGNCSGCIVTRDDTLLQDVSLNNKSLLADTPEPKDHEGLRRLLGPAVTKIEGQVLALNTPFGSNYHHFLLDTLPRIGLAMEAGIKIDDCSGFILYYNQSKYQQEVLGKLGIDRTKLIPSNSRLHLRFNTLHVPSISEPLSRADSIDYSVEGLEYVRRTLRPPLSTSHNKRRILLSRRLATSRRWIQEEEALPELERMGFERVECELLSVEDQARLFGEASVVIMPHGGGVANCVFCEPGTKIFELYNRLYYPLFMLSLASVLDLNYYAISGDASSRELEIGLDGPLEVRVKPEKFFKILHDYM